MWRKDHLVEASDKLEELEAEDANETEARRILELRANGGGRSTRRANKAVSGGIDINTPHTDRVGTYVDKQKQWAEGCIEVSSVRAYRYEASEPLADLTLVSSCRAGGG
jgi:hypothetical protein